MENEKTIDGGILVHVIEGLSVRVRTKRLLLRNEKLEDATSIQRLLLEPEGRIFQGGIKHVSVEELQNRIQKNIRTFALDFDEIKKGQAHCVLAVERMDNGKYIGNCGFRYCENMGKLEISYGYLKENWNHGFGHEAALALLSFGFNHTNMKEIFAAVNPENAASEKILKKLGMNFKNKIEWPNQGLVNLYGLSKEEYLQSQCLD